MLAIRKRVVSRYCPPVTIVGNEIETGGHVFSEWDLVRSSEIPCHCGLRKEPVFSMVMASMLRFHPSVGLRIRCTSEPHAK